MEKDKKAMTEKRRRQMNDATRRCRQKKKEEYETLKVRVQQLENMVSEEKALLAQMQKSAKLMAGRPTTLQASVSAPTQTTKLQLSEFLQLYNYLQRSIIALLSQGSDAQTISLITQMKPFGSFDEVEMISEASTITLECFREIFAKISTGPSKCTSTLFNSGYTADTLIYESNAIQRFSKLFRNIRARDFALGALHLYTASDKSFRRAHDPTVLDYEVIEKSECHAILHQTLDIGFPQPVEGTFLMKAFPFEGMWRFIAPVLAPRRPRNKSHSQPSLFYGFVCEDFNDADGYGTRWQLMVDNEIRDHIFTFDDTAFTFMVVNSLGRFERGVRAAAKSLKEKKDFTNLL